MSSARSRPVSDSFTTVPMRSERRTARDDDTRRRRRSEPVSAEERSLPPRNHRHSQSIYRHSPRHRDSDATLAERSTRVDVPLRSALKSPGTFKPTMPPRSYGHAMADRPPRTTYRPDQAYDFYSSGQNSSPSPHSQALDSFYLPAFYHFYPPQPEESLSSRVKKFFDKITTEPELSSPPPTRPVSRTNSYDASGSGACQSGQPGFGKVDTTAPRNEYDHDMFIRAMHMNGDDDLRDSLAEDADVQLYPQPTQGKHHELPVFHGRHHYLSDRERQYHTSSGDYGKVAPHKNTQSTYKQRRKEPKHEIIYNRDSIGAQQRFIIVLARALIAFGSPSHRVEPQLASVAAIFDMPAQFVHTPGCVQISFGLPEQHASETLLIKANVGLDLGRIHESHVVYRAVVRDEISATTGRKQLEDLLARPPLYSRAWLLALTFFQGFILCGSSFGGSLNDMWVAGVFSVLVGLAQEVASKSELSSSGADIFIAVIVSLVSRALSVRVPHKIFCYQAISSTSVTSLLPGATLLSGVLDIASKNIYLGAPKIVTGLMTSLYLGFGLTLGSDIWLHFDTYGRSMVESTADKMAYVNGTLFSLNASTPAWLSPANLTGTWTLDEQPASATMNIVNGCYRDPNWVWPLRPLPWYSLFVLLPVLNLILSMRRNQPLKTAQMPVMIAISCVSYVVTALANRKMGLAGHPDYTALLGSFVVSLLGNLYSRRFGGTAFTVMLTGIWLLIPTGLAEAGGLSSTYTAPGEDEYTESLTLARKMITVTIGVMSGVFLSARLIYTFGKKKNSAFVTF